MDDPAAIAKALEPISEWLHSKIEKATASADDHRRLRFDEEPEHGWYRTSIARSDLALLVDRDVPAGWDLKPISANGRILLVDPTGMLSLRVLHDPRLEAPAPGHSRARNLYWQQQEPTLVPAAQLIACWEADLNGLPTIRVVRPVGRWRYGGKEQVDLAFYLPRDAQGFADLGFVSSDAAIDIMLPIDEDAEVEQPKLQE
ncbi:MAG: hypothetical protein ACR2HR_04430 [Euzebya sp.]